MLREYATCESRFCQTRKSIITMCSEDRLGEKATRSIRGKQFNPVVYFVADVGRSTALGITDLVDVVRQAVAGGTRVVQFRDKTDTPRAEKKRLASLILKETRAMPDVVMIVNDDVALAAEIGADGAHIGQEDMSVSEARRVLGPDAIIGVSAGDITEAERGIADGADYLGVGPVFKTDSKADAGVPLGLTRLAEITCMVNGRVPVVGIGGILDGNCGGCAVVGCDGVAVIKSLLTAKDVKHMAQALRNRFEYAATGPASMRYPMKK